MTASPGYLAPAWRYAGDDWSGSNALTFAVYSVAPVYQIDVNGNVVNDANGDPIVLTPGTPMDLTGCEVQGSIAVRCEGRMLPAPLGAIIGDPTQGMLGLSLANQFTMGLPTNGFADWTNPDLSVLLVRPRIVDSGNNLITQGLQPLFVY